MSSPVKTKRVAFDENTVAIHQVVEAVGGKTIKIKALNLFAAGTVEVTLQSGSTTLAAWPLTINTQINLAMIEGADRYFETAENEAFSIDLGDAVRLTGFVVYEQS